LTYDDISELKYAGCAFKEALRLYPPATGVNRITKKDIVTRDFVIPKESIIAVRMKYLIKFIEVVQISSYYQFLFFYEMFSLVYLGVEETKNISLIPLSSSQRDFQNMKMIQMDRK
jgi:hypothetical protein